MITFPRRHEEDGGGAHGVGHPVPTKRGTMLAARQAVPLSEKHHDSRIDCAPLARSWRGSR
jgi:hypothetical protein